MTIVVPFDGSSLSEAALRRGGELGELLGERIVAVSVIPNSNTRYARERGWLERTEQFDPESIVATLSEQVETLVPDAIFKYEVVSRYAQTGEIASKIRRVARDEDADIVVIGSDNAGHIVSNVSSVGSSVAAGRTYDVMIVRNSAGE